MSSRSLITAMGSTSLISLIIVSVVVHRSCGQYLDYNSLSGNNYLGQYNPLYNNGVNNNMRPNEPYYNPLPAAGLPDYRPPGPNYNVPSIRPSVQPTRVELECYSSNADPRSQDIRWLVQAPGNINGNFQVIAQGTASSNPNYAATLTQRGNKWVSRLVIGTGSIPAQQLMGSYLCQYPDPLRPYNYLSSDILALDYRPFINSQPPYGHPDPYASPFFIPSARNTNNNNNVNPNPSQNSGTFIPEIMDNKLVEVSTISSKADESN